MTGKLLRLQRLFPGTRRGLFAVPLDHSVSMGPIDGLESTGAAVRELQGGGVDLFICTKGAVREVVPELRNGTLLGVHMSASTGLGPSPDTKALVGSATEAVALGADLLSIQTNFGGPAEADMLRDLGVAVDQCRAVGLPLLVMSYVKTTSPPTPEAVRHAARAVADLGADVVKTSAPATLDDLRALVRSTPVPVLVGGGPKVDSDERFLELVRWSVEAKAGGVCIGRNLFQNSTRAGLAARAAALLHAPLSARS